MKYQPTEKPLLELVNSRAAATLLNIHIDTLYVWVKKGYIPFYKVGQRLKFSKADLAEFLDKRKIKEV